MADGTFTGPAPGGPLTRAGMLRRLRQSQADLLAHARTLDWVVDRLREAHQPMRPGGSYPLALNEADCRALLAALADGVDALDELIERVRKGEPVFGEKTRAA